MNQTTVSTREFEDKTVDKAIEAACRYFDCEKDQLEIEIITRGSTGLFGLGGKKAKIKVTVKEEFVTGETEIKEESGQTEAQAVDDRPVEAHEEDSEADRTDVPAEMEQEAQETLQADREKIEEIVGLACQMVNEILEKSGLSGQAHVVEQTSKPFVNITGDDLSLIIGKEGQTLDALEYVVNLWLRCKEPDVHYRVMLEAAGYRDRRRKNLVALAERLAVKVKRSGRPVSLQPMPARERRIVHVALKDFKGVKTHSSGQGASRKVVIAPAKRKRHSGRNWNKGRAKE